MRITDIFLAFPEMIAAIALAGIMGPGTTNLVFAISCVSWTKYARVARGITLTTKEMIYVKAAHFPSLSQPSGKYPDYEFVLDKGSQIQ
jgi:peptide/nickel transport system permease protein